MLGCLCALSLVACGGAEPERNTPPTSSTNSKTAGGAVDAPADGPRARTGDLSRQGLTERTFDLNGDGRADQFHLVSNGALQRIERDLNFDGRIDAYEYYRGGALTEEEIDLDLDGLVDVVKNYRGGVAVEKRYAIGFRADLAVLRLYDDSGQLVRVERDTDRNGVVDTWEHFAGGGEPIRVEVDDNGDGRPDRTIGAAEDAPVEVDPPSGDTEPTESEDTEPTESEDAT